jgi:hypothetical protein
MKGESIDLEHADDEEAEIVEVIVQRSNLAPKSGRQVELIIHPSERLCSEVPRQDPR